MPGCGSVCLMDLLSPKGCCCCRFVLLGRVARELESTATFRGYPENRLFLLAALGTVGAERGFGPGLCRFCGWRVRFGEGAEARAQWGAGWARNPECQQNICPFPALWRGLVPRAKVASSLCEKDATGDGDP